MAGRPIKKRTCAQPVVDRAMPENEIPPAMRVDIYLTNAIKNPKNNHKTKKEQIKK